MRDGVSASSEFVSITVPDNGEKISLAALTLSIAPHSSVTTLKEVSPINE